MYHHMNNTVYSSLFDSIINAYLIEHCGASPADGAHIGLVVHSYCDFFGSVGFPSLVDLGLRVTKLGKTSVAYEVGVFEKGHERVRAVGGYVHVFVERQGMRPAKNGMSDEMRKGLGKLLIQGKPKVGENAKL
jgi:acyl-CoA thioester hydrolase